jgi:hypothetical protein
MSIIAALRHQLSNPNLIREYVKAYRDQRDRVENRCAAKAIESSLKPKPKFSGL